VEESFHEKVFYTMNRFTGPDYQDQNKYYFTKIGFTER